MCSKHTSTPPAVDFTDWGQGGGALEQTPSFPTQRLLYPVSMRTRTSSEPPPVLCERGWESSLPTQPTTSAEVVSQTRRFQRQQMVLGHNIQLNHQRPEDRQEFSESLECRLNQLIEQVRQREEQTGETIFPRDLHSNSNRQLCAWDEDDTLPPELLCEWMRNSCVRYHTTRPDLFLPSSSKIEEQPIYVHAPIQQYLGPKYYECDHPINAPASQQQHRFLSQPIMRASSSSYGHYSDSSGFCSSDSAYHLQYGQKEAVEQDRRTASKDRQKVNEITTSNNTNVLIMSYRETNGVPFVAKLSERDTHKVTFKEFRRQFGISSKTNKRFLFKSMCEDDSAPFQWTVANEDDMLLPVFEGKITAECRSISESY
uniref:DIX domain-containing protein n=1 Tax=Ditylenchus dipsaci TaxID=166011 RepID=A0A915CSG8_9BILA